MKPLISIHHEDKYKICILIFPLKFENKLIISARTDFQVVRKGIFWLKPSFVYHFQKKMGIKWCNDISLIYWSALTKIDLAMNSNTQFKLMILKRSSEDNKKSADIDWDGLKRVYEEVDQRSLESALGTFWIVWRCCFVASRP